MPGGFFFDCEGKGRVVGSWQVLARRMSQMREGRDG